MDSQNPRPRDTASLSKDQRGIDGALWPATQTTDARQCPSCRQLVPERCGDYLIQQSWFRLAPEARRCSLHGEVARARSR